MKYSLNIENSTTPIAFTCVFVCCLNAAGARDAPPKQEQGGEEIDEAALLLSLSWQDVTTRLKDHPYLLAKQLETKAAEAAVDTAGAAENPSISAETGYGTSRDGDLSRIEWGVSLSVPFGWLATRGAEKEAARRHAAIAEKETASLERTLVLETNILFWQTAYSEARIDSLDALIEQTDRLAETIRRRVEKGDARPVEEMRIGVEQEKLEGMRDQAEGARLTAAGTLALWLGMDFHQPLTASTNMETLPAPISRQEALRRIHLHHPDMAEAEARNHAFGQAVTLERRKRAPQIDVDIFADQELDKSSYGGGLKVELPILNRNKGAIRQAELLSHAGRVHLTGRGREITAQTLAAHVACNIGRALALRYETRILPQAEAAADIALRAYELGETPLIDVIDARRTLLETEAEYLDALAGAQIDCGRLNIMVGTAE